VATVDDLARIQQDSRNQESAQHEEQLHSARNGRPAARFGNQ
jgi:hypothetical protein